MGMEPSELGKVVDTAYPITFSFFAVLILIFVLKSDLNQILISVEIFLMILMATFAPSITSRLIERNRYFYRASFETILLTFTVCGGTILLNGTIISAKNILVTFFIFIILIGGSYYVDYGKKIIFNKITQYLGEKKAEEWVSTIKANFDKESKSYYLVTFSSLIINFIGLVLSWTKQFTLLALVIGVLLVSSFIILFFLLNSFLLMSSSLYDDKIFFEDNPQKLITHHERKDLEDAIIVTDLRKLLLCDSIHNFALFFAFVNVILSSLDANINMKAFLISTLVLSFIFTQLPYAVGQKSLHDQFLKNYDGLKRADISENLKKYAPLCPKSEFITALVSPYTFGFFLGILLEEFLISLVK